MEPYAAFTVFLFRHCNWGVLAMTLRTPAIIIIPFHFALLLAIGRSDLARVMPDRAAYIISGEASTGKTRNR